METTIDSNRLDALSFYSDHFLSCAGAQGGKIANQIAVTYGFGDAFKFGWKWPLVLGFMLLSFCLIYYLASDLHEQKWVGITPGSMIGVALWLLVSFGFKLYCISLILTARPTGRSAQLSF